MLALCINFLKEVMTSRNDALNRPTDLGSSNPDKFAAAALGGGFSSAPVSATTTSSNEARDVFVGCYQALLGREPDPQGLAHWINRYCRNASWTTLLSDFVNCEEFKHRHQGAETSKRVTHPLEALHASRVQMVKQLPKARRIVDLGGGSAGDPVVRWF